MREIRFAGGALLHPERSQLLIGGQPVALGGRALEVLRALAEKPGELVTKRELLDRVWPDLVVEENNLQVQISTLRRILGPQAITTVSASTSPESVRTRRMRPSTTSNPRISTPARTVRAPISWARSRMIVPARNESTTPTVGVWKPPRITDGSRKGTSSATRAGLTSSDSIPHDFDDASRRR